MAGLLEAFLAGLRSLGGSHLESRLGLVGRAEAGLAAARSETVAELARRDGEAHAAETVRSKLRQSRGAARRDVKLAGQLADLEGTGEALAAGAITPQHARAIAEAAEHTDIDEDELLEAATRQPTDVFAATVRDHVNERSRGDGLEERRRRQRARRELSISKQSDGMYKLRGLFDPVAGARLETAIAVAARKLWAGEDPKDRATVPQRFADALEMLVTRSDTGKSRDPALVIVADYDVVAGQLEGARLADGTPLAADELVRLAVEAKILPAIFDRRGQPLWLGREHRHASVAQRIALAVRDRRCVGCGVAHSFCQPHHIWWWERGGPTDIDNLCLLCGDCHHKQVHTRRAEVVRRGDGAYMLQSAGTAGGRNGTDATGGVQRDVSQPLRR